MTISRTVCNRIFSIGKDGLGIRRMTFLYNLFGWHSAIEEDFQSVRVHICTPNTDIKGRQSTTQCS